MPLISVIVPVYKVEPYLSRCVDSILSQTFTDFELILIDDGSPDNCGEICDEYAQKDKRIQVIHKENGGLSSARNAGIDWVFANSNSQFITFVDSDDLITRDYLEKLNDTILDECIDIATCKMHCFSDFEKLLSDIVMYDEPSTLPRTYTGRDAAFHLYKMDGEISIEACTKLYRKTLFANIRFPENKIHEDQAIIPILLYSSCKVATIDNRLYCYFQRSDSITKSSFSNKHFDDIDALESCMNYFKAQQEYAIVELVNTRKIVLLSLYNLQAKHDNKHRQIPKKYKISCLKALYNLEKRMSYDRFSWRLSQFYPRLVKPYSICISILKKLKIYKNTNN